MEHVALRDQFTSKTQSCLPLPEIPPGISSSPGLLGRMTHRSTQGYLFEWAQTMFRIICICPRALMIFMTSTGPISPLQQLRRCGRGVCGTIVIAFALGRLVIVVVHIIWSSGKVFSFRRFPTQCWNCQGPKPQQSGVSYHRISMTESNRLSLMNKERNR